MFKIKNTASFSWPVKVKTPTDGGRLEEHTFDVTFKRVDHETTARITKAVMEAGETTAASRELVVGWNGIEDDGGPVPFSDTALEELLKIQRVGTAIMAAFFEASFSDNGALPRPNLIAGT